MSCITSLVAQREASKNEDRVPVQKKEGQEEEKEEEKRSEGKGRERKRRKKKKKEEERTGCHFRSRL